MAAPRVLVMAGYGLNCEEETLFAFEQAGGSGEIIHLNDLIDTPERMEQFQILAIPGGFSYGDDTGSGNALANRLRHNLWEEIARFVDRETLTLGICNGCQVVANLGLLPTLEGEWGKQEVALLHNTSGRYQCRWVHLQIYDPQSPWLTGIDSMYVPVAHGEGNFYMDAETLDQMKAEGMIAARYVTPDGQPAKGEFPYNPNGSLEDIAALTDQSGRVLAMMPHPERGIFFTQRDDWPLLKEEYKRSGKTLPKESDGMQLFRNAVAWFA